MQAQHLGWPTRGGGNGIDVQRRSVACQQRLGFEHAVQLAEYLLLEFQILVDRFDYEVHIADRRVVIRPRYPGDPRVGFALFESALAYVMGISLGHRGQGLLKHLRVVIDPLHSDAGVGQAHHDATAHGACTDHGGALDIEGCLAHVCSLVGDPRTAITIASH